MAKNKIPDLSIHLNNNNNNNNNNNYSNDNYNNYKLMIKIIMMIIITHECNNTICAIRLSYYSSSIFQVSRWLNGNISDVTWR